MSLELQKQHGYAEQLDREFDMTNAKLNTVQRKLGELLETKGT